MEEQHKSKIVWVLFIIIVALVGLNIYQYYLANNLEIETEVAIVETSTTPTTSTTASVSATPTATADWKTYTSTELGLSFKYPASWGDPKISNSDYSDKASNSQFGGKSYFITFSENKTLYQVAGYTSDHKAPMSSSDFTYNGNNSNLNIDEFINITSENTYFIQKVTVANENTYTKTLLRYMPEASGFDIVSNTLLNGNTQYKGIVISTRYYSIGERLSDLGYYIYNDDKLKEAAVPELKGLLDENSTDASALAQYLQYKLWLTTFQLTQ